MNQKECFLQIKHASRLCFALCTGFSIVLSNKLFFAFTKGIWLYLFPLFLPLLPATCRGRSICTLIYTTRDGRNVIISIITADLSKLVTVGSDKNRMAETNSIEYTPTWIVALVCSVIVLISLVAERGLHHLGKFLKRAHQDSLIDSLQKLKEELMILGFISLLLTVFQQSISKICIPSNLTNSMLPCNKKSEEHTTSEYSSFTTTWGRRRLLSESSEESHCHTGKAPLMSIEALHQLHIFIFVLAVVYVISCGIIMVLGGIKVRRWKHWEDSIRREIANSANDPNRVRQIHARHYHEFKQRGNHSIGWMISFFKQFYGSVTKSDYISLRLGFIMTHWPSNPTFNFHKYMTKTLEHDFKKVVGVSWYLWTFVVLFLLVNLKGWHSYFFMSFLPLILLVVVGAKLEHIITCLAEEIGERSRSDEAQRDTVVIPVDGAPWVKPSDKHFWFGRPHIVLYLIHFILFQNSFEIAFFFWVLCTYGPHSCILDKTAFFIPRLIIGVIVQVLCSYSTLPLYTIVTQMGSSFKPNIFNQHVEHMLHDWANERRRRGDENRIEMLLMSPESVQIPAAENTAVASKFPDST